MGWAYYYAVEDEANLGNWCIVDYHGNQATEADMAKGDARMLAWLLNHPGGMKCIILSVYQVARSQQLAPR